ncbi:hypothetical protein ACQPW1_46330 [Nocardia sp. CA-128927]|uniref:hypothetical protein n=1 Tax=Nocardia sp. CA-128927 TaxID=3239975 RepID=UPI003D95F241
MTVRITRTGRAALTALNKEARQVSDDLLAPLNPQKRAQLSDLMRRLFDHAYPPTA